MPKAIKKKEKKKADVAPEIEVKDRLASLKTSFEERKKNVLIYGLIGLALVVIFAGVQFYQYSSKKKAQELAYDAYKVYYNEYQEKTKPKEEQFSTALDLLQKAYSEKKSPALLLYMANANYELKKYDEALKILNDFVSQHGDQKDLLPLAYRKIAAIHLEQKRDDDALKALDAIIASDTPVFKDYALLEAGKILDKKGEKEKAKEKFKEIVDKYADSPFVEEAKNRAGTEEKKADAGLPPGLDVQVQQVQTPPAAPTPPPAAAPPAEKK